MYNSRNEKENENKLDLQKKGLLPLVHKCKFDEIGDDDNVGGNKKNQNTICSRKTAINSIHPNTKSKSESKGRGNPEYQ